MKAEKQAYAKAVIVKYLYKMNVSTVCYFGFLVTEITYVRSSLKFRYKNGAHKESKPCQYTYCWLLTTQAFNILFSFICPVLDDNSSLY